jgi:hypothetical protein
MAGFRVGRFWTLLLRGLPGGWPVSPATGREAVAVAVPVLRFNDVPLGGGRRRVEVAWQDDMARQVAVSLFDYQVSEAEAEKVRWYLEDYPEFPAHPAPRVAVDAESVLAETGTALFSRLFSGMDAAGIWAQARARLGEVRVEVDTDPAEVPGLPWELLRDPRTGTPLALAAGMFVRTHLQAAGQVSLPVAAGDRLRVLLVICRPGRGMMCRSGRWPPGWPAAARQGWRAWTWTCCARPLLPAWLRCCTRRPGRAARTMWCTSTATAPTSTWRTCRLARMTVAARTAQPAAAGSGCRRCGTGSR